MPPRSLLGPEHEAAARRLAWRAAAGALAASSALGLLAAAAASLSRALLPPRGALALYGLAELVFLVLYLYRWLLLSYLPISHRPLSHSSPPETFARAMAHLEASGAPGMRQFLSLWFHGAPFEEIGRENVAELIAYAFFFCSREELAAEGRTHELEAMVAHIEAGGVQLRPGYNAQLRWMSHMWDPVAHWYRPAAFYLAMEAAALVCRTALCAAGFRRGFWKGLEFFSANSSGGQQQGQGQGQGQGQRGQEEAQAQEAAATEGRGAGGGGDVPLVLLHGVGMGLLPYFSFLINMAATGRPVVAPQLAHVSQRWVLWVPTVDEVGEALEALLRREGLGGPVCLVAHSYGTAVASRLLQQRPAKVQQLCLIDPVVFNMFCPQLLRHFFYVPPASGSLVGDFLLTSAARELHVAATLSRRFFWTDVNLWEEQLPPGSLVVLAGRDVLMAAGEVKEWLEQRTQAVVMYHPHLLHAGCLMDVAWQQQILAQLLQLLDQAPPTLGQQWRQQQQAQPGWPPSPRGGGGGGGSGGHQPALDGPPAHGCQGWQQPASGGWAALARGGADAVPAVTCAGCGGAACGMAARLVAPRPSPTVPASPAHGLRGDSAARGGCQLACGGSSCPTSCGSGRASSDGASCSTSLGPAGSSASSCSPPPDGCTAPAAAAAAAAAAAPHLRLRLQPALGRCGPAPAGVAASGGVSPVSLRTYVSGCSNQEWVDAAALSASRDAAVAARALLQPLAAIQRGRQHGRRAAAPSCAWSEASDAAPPGLHEVVGGAGATRSAGGSSSGSGVAASARARAVLRRVEAALLQRRRPSSSGAKATGAAAAPAVSLA